MKLFNLLVLCLILLTATPVLAQNKPADADMQMLIDKVKADKKLVVAANMSLTEAEAKAFWPIYDAYQKELQTINQNLAKTILAYADAYNNNSLTDDQARRLSNEALSIDQAELTLRKSYAAKLDQVIPAKKAARYIQIENKIRAAIRYEMAAGIPLVR
jgi:hypothetical protein